MTCKVKIGSSYEPKWFEKRATQGTYSAKNVPLDNDAMWLQNALLDSRPPFLWKSKILISICTSAFLFWLLDSYGVFK